MQVEAGDDYHNIVDRSKEHPVGEASDENPSRFTMNDRVRQRSLCSSINGAPNRREELLAEASLLLLVPPVGAPQVTYGGRSKDDPFHRELDRT
jgi:hypothetical protein